MRVVRFSGLGLAPTGFKLTTTTSKIDADFEKQQKAKCKTFLENAGLTGSELEAAVSLCYKNPFGFQSTLCAQGVVALCPETAGDIQDVEVPKPLWKNPLVWVAALGGAFIVWKLL